MRKFAKNINLSNREAMITFLRNHFRYDTLNSWNGQKSYANNVKIHSLGLPSDIENKLFDLMMCDNAYDEIETVLGYWNAEHNDCHVAFNGRSNGYLVLYKASVKPTDYKSFCTKCGQKNYKTATPENNKCGKCGKNTRINFVKSPTTKCVSYAGIDNDIDYADLSDAQLADRVELVHEFDMLCDDIVATAIRMTEECDIVEETVFIPNTVRLIKPKTDKS